MGLTKKTLTGQGVETKIAVFGQVVERGRVADGCWALPKRNLGQKLGYFHKTVRIWRNLSVQNHLDVSWLNAELLQYEQNTVGCVEGISKTKFVAKEQLRLPHNDHVH